MARPKEPEEQAADGVGGGGRWRIVFVLVLGRERDFKLDDEAWAGAMVVPLTTTLLMDGLRIRLRGVPVPLALERCSMVETIRRVIVLDMSESTSCDG